MSYNLNGKSVFVTGATSGIGKEVALGLARLGAIVVFTTRDERKGLQVKDEIILATSKGIPISFICKDGSGLITVLEL